MSVRRPAGAPWSVVDVERLIVQGRYGNAAAALAELDANLATFRPRASGEDWLIALYARALLLNSSGATRPEVVASWTTLETQALAARQPQWVTIARAQRAISRLEHGEPAAALGDLARIDDLDLADGNDADATAATDSVTGLRLLDAIAGAFFRIRITDRAEQARHLIEHQVDHREPMDQAAHWAAWATELASRAMEPVARGGPDPEPHQLARAAELAERVNSLAMNQVPEPLNRTANAVLALVETYQGHARDALRLLGSDGLGQPIGLRAPESQIAVIAALRAHTVLGSYATARSLDDNAERIMGSLPTMILEVCRARARLDLERSAGAPLEQAQTKLSELLVKLGWQSLELLSQTSRQALEHQQLLTESRTDALTGVGNRRALDEVLRSMLRFSQLPLGMVLLDLDGFKRINDEYTHAVGDEVLRQVARTVQEQLRPNDKLLRYGGDEFVVLLEGAGDTQARKVAVALSEVIHALPWARLATGLQVRVTTGHAALHALSGRRPAADAERLFRRADESLLETKRLRRAAAAQLASRKPDPLNDPLPQPPVGSPVDDLASPLNGSPASTGTVESSAPTATPSDPPTPPTLTPDAAAATRRARRAALMELHRNDINQAPRSPAAPVPPASGA